MQTKLNARQAEAVITRIREAHQKWEEERMEQREAFINSLLDADTPRRVEFYQSATKRVDEDIRKRREWVEEIILAIKDSKL